MLNPAKWEIWNDPDGTVQVIKRLLSENLRAYIPRYMVAFVFMGMVAATTAASAWIMKDVINEVFINRDKAMIYVIAGAVIWTCTLLLAVTVYLKVRKAFIARFRQRDAAVAKMNSRVDAGLSRSASGRLPAAADELSRQPSRAFQRVSGLKQPVAGQNTRLHL